MRRDSGRPIRAGLGLAVVFALALLVRSLGFEQVFQDDGTVVFAAGDAYYHARRILFGIVHFPSILQFDPCINWPDGAPVPHPPLYDTAAALLARELPSVGARTVLAWLPVGLGALAVFPIYALGRNLSGPGVGLTAALLYAGLPIVINYASVGNPDHHAAVALFGALLLWLYVAFLDPGSRGRRVWGVALGLAAARLALMGTWHGSALYLVPGEAAVILYGIAADRRDVLKAEAASVLLTAVLVAPWVAFSPTPVGGPFSATELSALHLLGLVGVAVLCLSSLALQQSWPKQTPRDRLFYVGSIATGLGLIALVYPDIRHGLEPALAFVSKGDEWGNSVMEQMPFFFLQGELSRQAGEMRMGYYAYLLPIVPLAFAGLTQKAALFARGLFLFVWSFLLAGLTLYQLRFANDFAPVACVGFALLLLYLADAITQYARVSQRIAQGCAVAVGLLLAWPTLGLYFQPLVLSTFESLSEKASSRDRALDTLAGTQVRFAQRVRHVTPDQPGCRPQDAANVRPRYGILAHPTLGHTLHLVGHRATPADPFGPYLGETNFRRAIDFFRTDSEPEAVAIARQLKTPFIATAADIGADEDRHRMDRRLHETDGSATPERPHLAHFRLVTEGPRGGVPLSFVFDADSESAIPYKLFEVVPGAIIEFPAAPGVKVTAELHILTRAGRRFAFRARGQGGESGVARLRVPYATGARGDVNTAGAYRLESPTRSGSARVPETAVQNQQTISARIMNGPAQGEGPAEPSRRSYPVKSPNLQRGS